jgi:hypothetical protein
VARKKQSKAGQADVSTQHADSKGLNAKRGTKPSGVAAIGVVKGQGTASFRKNRKGGD